MSQEQAAIPFYDFMYGKFLLKELFEITMHEDDYVEMAYNVFRDIGNIATKVHLFKFTVDDTLVVNLPCNVEFIEAVSRGEILGVEDAILWTDELGTDANYRIGTLRGVRNKNRSTLHPQGDFIQYDVAGTMGDMKLSFDEDSVGITGECMYRGLVVDTDGNPLLTRKEAEAIAYKMAHLKVQKDAFMGKPGGQMLQYIQAEAGRKMAAAKIPEHVTQNQWNRMLSAMTRHDRKVFWSDYKTLQ